MHDDRRNHACAEHAVRRGLRTLVVHRATHLFSSARRPSHPPPSSPRGRLALPDDRLSANGATPGALRAPPRGFIGQITRTTNIPTFIPPALPATPDPSSREQNLLSPAACVVTALSLPPSFARSLTLFSPPRALSRLHVGTLREKRGDSRHGVNRVYPLSPLTSLASPWRSFAQCALASRPPRVREFLTVSTFFNTTLNATGHGFRES